MTSEDSAGTELPFSLLVALRAIGEDGLAGRFEASPKERAALAETFELDRLDLFEGQYELTPKRNGKIAMDAAFTARLVQQCVVSLEPVETEVAERFAVEFVPEAEGGLPQVLDLAPDGILAEPYAGGLIDVGAVLAQQLSLAIDPYPRKADAKLDWAGENDTRDGDTGEGAEPQGPFSALARLGRDKAG